MHALDDEALFVDEPDAGAGADAADARPAAAAATAESAADAPRDVPLDAELAATLTAVRAADAELLAAHARLRAVYAKRCVLREEPPLSLFEFCEFAAVAGNQSADPRAAAELLKGRLSKRALVALFLCYSPEDGADLDAAELEAVRSLRASVAAVAAQRAAALQRLEARCAAQLSAATRVVGARLVAQLLVFAGSLRRLVELPGAALARLGNADALALHVPRAAPTELGAHRTRPREGFGALYWHAQICAAPPAERKRCVRALAGACSLALKHDCFRLAGGGAAELGADFEARAAARLRPLEQPPPQQKKPLQVAPKTSSGRRGGRRKRRFKEKFGWSVERERLRQLGVSGEDAELHLSDSG